MYKPTAISVNEEVNCMCDPVRVDHCGWDLIQENAKTEALTMYTGKYCTAHNLQSIQSLQQIQKGQYVSITAAAVQWQQQM